MSQKKLTRRNFIRKAAAASAAIGAPMIVPSTALGISKRPAPSNRIVMGCIGMGGMGTGNMQSFANHADAQVVAVCDVDTERRLKAKNIVEEIYAAQSKNGKYAGCADFNDFREIIAQNDIDAVLVCTPDH